MKWVGTQEHLKMPELRIKTGGIVQEFSTSDKDSKVEKISSLFQLCNDTAILELMNTIRTIMKHQILSSGKPS